MIYLDTHVIVWTYHNRTKKFSEAVQTLMNKNDWLISPIVRLELQYLYEIGRVNDSADTILNHLSQRAGLTICPKPFNDIISAANQLAWTRDPFDRILVAHASLNNDLLVTSDKMIQTNYTHTRW